MLHIPQTPKPLARDISLRARDTPGIMTQVRKSMVRPPVRSIIHSLKLVVYLSVQADKPCSISHLSKELPIGMFVGLQWSHGKPFLAISAQKCSSMAVYCRNTMYRRTFPVRCLTFTIFHCSRGKKKKDILQRDRAIFKHLVSTPVPRYNQRDRGKQTLP